MKIFNRTKKVNPTHVMAWAVVKLADGSIELPKTDTEFAALASTRLWDEGDSKIEWTFDGNEWFLATPDTWDIYWLEGC